MATIVPLIEQLDKQARLAERLGETAQLVNDIEARAESLGETRRLLGRDDLLRIAAGPSPSLTYSAERQAIYVGKRLQFAEPLAGLGEDGIPLESFTAATQRLLCDSASRDFAPPWIVGLGESAEKLSESAGLIVGGLNNTHALTLGMGDTAARLSEFTGSLTSAYGLSAGKIEAFSRSVVESLGLSSAKLTGFGDSLSDSTLSFLESVKPLGKLGASLPDVITTLGQADYSLGIAYTPLQSTPAFEALRVSPQLTGDIDIMLGRVDYSLGVPYAPSERRDSRQQITRAGLLAELRAELRNELEDLLDERETRFLVKLQAYMQVETRQSGIAVAGALPEKPPRPRVAGATWDDVFDWFYRAPHDWCLTFTDLARMLGYSEDHVTREHGKYKAQYGERRRSYAGKSGMM